ncbi:MAG TPA: HlyD family efflux transporter periplasmic adaptor subunit [Gammaproteobacteria bacterium]|nr:HlyD family efflux transporter periplasmic adaptor subunit [Gammaproteobacteria bacterium]
MWHRTLALATLAAVIIAALLWGFWPRPVTVDVAPVMRQPLRVTLEEEGRTRVRDRYVVSAPVAGYARRIGLEVGERVVAGQPLVTLEPLRAAVLDPRRRAEAEARVAAARAAQQAARQKAEAAAADADFATRELARIQRLRSAGVASQDELEQAESVQRRAAALSRSARFAVDIARFELDAARAALRFAAAPAGDDAPDNITLKAPVNGVVLKRFRESEGALAMGQALLEIGDPHALEVEVDVLSADAVRLSAGTPVSFTRWGGGQVLKGRVRRVEPVGFTKISALGVEEQRVWVVADLISPPRQWARLGDGYRVEASFLLWEGKNVLQIPASALFRMDGGWAVFVVSRGRAVQTPVEVGQRNGLAAQILSGLSAGQTVIVHPGDAVRDGVAVAPG